MKRKITQFLMLALALVWAIPQTSAQEYDISVNTTPDWVNSFSGLAEANFPSASAKGMAIGLNGLIITHEPAGTDVISGTNIKPFYRIGNGILNKFTCGFAANNASTPPKGSLVANDANNNIIYFHANSFGGQITRVQVFKAADAANTSKETGLDKVSSTTNVGILGTPHFIWAEGNCYDGTGYVWYVQNSASKAVRVTITNGILQANTYECTLKDASGNALTLSANGPHYMKKYGEGKLFIHDRGGKLYDVAVTGTEGICTPITITSSGNIHSNNGADLVEFKGHKLLFVSPYNNTDKYNSKFRIYDLTDGNKLLAEIDQFKVTDNYNLSSSTFGIWVRAIPNSSNENLLDIYTYCPGFGAAKYTITATQVTEYTDPVQNLKSAIKYGLDGEGNATQNAVLTWSAPATGAENVTGYTIYRGDTQIATVGNDVLTYTDAEALTAETTYKVIPSYDTNSVGTDATTTIAPHVFKAPGNLTVTPYDGYARAQIQWTRAETDPAGLRIRYELWRDGVCLADHLARVAYMDTKIPEGNHSYTVYSVYYADIDGDGEYEDEITRLSVGPVAKEIIKLDEQLVNFTLEVVYNHTMWDIWNNGIANGVSWNNLSLGNFNPNVEEVNSSGNLCYVDAEHYRQGALVTDPATGKKYWVIAQKSTLWSLSLAHKDNGPHSAGILVLSAENEDLEKGGAPVYYKGANLDPVMFNGQTVGIAADDEGTIFMRGHSHPEDTASYSGYMNFTKELKYGKIYKPTFENGTVVFSKGYTVDLSSVEFSPERPADYGSSAGQTKRVDYYRMSGKLFTDGYAYLYGAASHARTMTVVKLKYANDAVTVDDVYQYTPTAYESGKEILLDAGSENYAFPIADVSTGIGSAGYIYQRRGNGYFYVPTGATTNEEKSDVLTTTGKIANAGGTTVRMVNEEGATQLFLIVPESYYSQNIGSFSVNIVTDNDFSTGIVPVANMNQTDMVPNGNITNVNGNWIFAEYDAEDECIYIYQYVPGIRIAKYRLYGSISYYSVPPTLDIATTYHETEGDITNFTATASWKTPEDYTGTGDYVIRHYEVNLLDGQNKIIDTRLVDADTITATLIPGSDIIKEYTLTFDDLSDITDQNVTTGGTSSNFFVDDDTKYTIEVTAIYNSKIAEDNDMIGGLRRSATQTAQAEHSYTPIAPVPTVDIYKGVSGTVTGLYRIEFGLETPLESDEKVSHYELYYTRKKIDWNTPDASTESGYVETLVTERMTGFEAVTSSVARSVSFTEGQDVISGEVVRNGQSATYLSDSKNQSYAVFHYNSNLDKWTEYNNDPTTWTYTVKAVYADDNALLRKTTDATVETSDFTPTGVEEVVEGVELLEVYPIPADAELNIKSSQAIEMVTILSTTGAEVKRVLGNGESQMTIDVEDIASGYYFLKVNNLPMTKIIVK